MIIATASWIDNDGRAGAGWAAESYDQEEGGKWEREKNENKIPLVQHVII